MTPDRIAPLQREWPSFSEVVPVHEYPVDVRWADMDVLNHVNNVKYVEFTDNARIGLAELDTRLDAAWLRLCEIDFLSALESRTDPASVASVLIGDELFQEVRSVREGSTVVHARVRSVFGDGEPIPRESGGRETVHWTRFTDGCDGIVSNASLFGIFQEARILAIDRGPSLLPHERVVVARNSILVARPILVRPEPYVVSTQLKRLGRASMEMTMQLCDESEVLAQGQVIVVGFDQRTGRSRPFTDSERTALTAALPRSDEG